ncbi:MAG: A/G-specific adenine glycosylase [Pseudomonadota bacterium]
MAQLVVAWQAKHGRSHLPWQNTRDPYRIWLSEVMLQQTQVATVLDYFSRFMLRFPDVAALAAADLDEVLGMWSGLGYYSRARNLHACARRVVADHGGAFPRSAAELQTLPGIGRSTAAAIASFCFDECVAILDGNVKRVLSRVLAYSGDLADGRAEKELWAKATALLPRAADMPRYTQGLMDLGAGVCARTKPQCAACPLRTVCRAYAQQNPEAYPVKTRKLKRSTQKLWLLWARQPDGSVWLERRPDAGIWGGLYCLPVFESEEQLAQILPEGAAQQLEFRPTFRHVLTHKDLYLSPVASSAGPIASEFTGGWYAPSAWPSLGVPAPIRKLLESEA